ncbi:MAG: efflux RND transporter periplasmic adaptor subunit [Gammaproteobacteria bacterium]|nr:efflux RND transporter periplasmic adaptor subunit [Gammaproteobacteria bacterium]
MNNIIVPVRSHQVATNTVPIGGSVVAHKSVILTAQLPGRVVNIAGEEGDRFGHDTVLLSLNVEELLAKRRAAETQWASAAAELKNAAVQYSRRLASPATTYQAPGGMGVPGMFDQVFTNPMSSMMGLRRPGIERGADIYSGGTRVDQARHSLEQARSQIAQIDTKLRDAKSIAPFDGVIVKKYVEEGDTVQPGQPLLGFEDMSQLQIVADIPTRLSNILQEGNQVAARTDVSNTTMSVRVALIFPKADPVRHTVRMKFDLPLDVKIAPGTYAEVWIPMPSVSDDKLITVPAGAVVHRGGLPVVFVVSERKRTEMRLVRVGEIIPSGEIVILFGLQEDEFVLDRPTSTMTSGRTISDDTSDSSPVSSQSD